MADPTCAFDHCRVIDANKHLVEDLAPDGSPRRKVAIVGFASSTRNLAPFNDPTWSIWGENQLYRMLTRASRWFEIHPHDGPRSYLADMVPGTDYVGWMRACPIPLYMVSRREEFPNSITYPMQELVEYFDLPRIRPDLKERGYFHSTIDFMVALAIYEGAEEIAIYGVDMAHDTEYIRQKPSGSFWIGLAHGRGVTITVPTASALINNCGYAYGYDPEESFLLQQQLESRRRALTDRQAQLQTEMNAIAGALQENDHWMMYAKHTQRGATLLPATSTVI